MTPEDPSMIRIERCIHLGRKLGSGGMGRVVDGFSPDLGQYLAVKILHPEAAERKEVRDRFEEEIAIMASIDHPGSLPIYGAADGPDDCPAYVMKKVEGKTLAQLLATHRNTPNDLTHRRRLLGILLDACETAAYAHEIGIVHRDLKPENILIDRHGSVYVIDWGLARRQGGEGRDSEITRTIQGTVMGSPGYLSPEQAEGRNDITGPPSDVFSLGAILYEILTGSRPFHSESIREEMLGAVHKDPSPPRSVNLLVPRSISAVCMKALEKEALKRYPTASELATDLSAFLEGRPVSAKKPNLLERYYYASRTSPTRTTLATAVTGIILSIGLFIAAQVFIDHRITEKISDELELIDQDLSINRQQWRSVRDQLAAGNLDPENRESLTYESEALNARWVIAQMEGMRLLGSTQSLHFLNSSSRFDTAWRRRTLTFCEEAIELNFPALSHAVTADILENVEHGTSLLPISEVEVIKLRSLHEEALEMMITSPENP